MKILIAYDGSDCSDVALNDLRNAGLPAQAEALIVCAADTFLPDARGEEDVPPGLERVIRKAREHADEAVAIARANAERAGSLVLTMFPQWKIATSTRTDSPAWAIVNAAEEWKP